MSTETPKNNETPKPTVDEETIFPDSSEQLQNVKQAPIPANKLNLRFLLVNGIKADLQFDQTDTIEAVKRSVIEHWPKEFNDNPGDVSKIRILHMGAMLDNAVVLDSRKMVLGQTTVVHLLISGSSQTEKEKAKAKEGKTSKCCIIL